MVVLLKDEILTAKWQRFFEEKYKPEIETIAAAYPEKRSIYVDYDIIDKYNTELTDGLIHEPYKYIFNAEESFKAIDTTVGRIQPHIKINNLPDTCKKTIRELRSENMGKLVSIEGLVKKRTTVRADVKIAALQCVKCGAVIRVLQDGEVLLEPSECYEEQGGCGRVSSFKLLTSLSGFLDAQKIQLQENPEGLQGGQQPEKITVYLEDDLVGKTYPGDRIRIDGIVQGIQHRKGNLKLISFDFVIMANNIEHIESLYEETKITDEDIEKIKKIANDKEVYTNLRESIVPSIYGMNREKDAIVLQAFGGVPREQPDGTHIRGDIHALLIGDPGIAKSQMLSGVSKAAPRSVFCTGTGSTGVGLTAAAIKDEFGEGQWSLEAGALVLADMGIACIDEIDKMSDDDRENLHPAMEQQEICISKAGINATLKSRCAILAAANPKLGRFDTYVPIAPQINMPSSLLSRFDLIFPIADKPNEENDLKLAKHILNARKNPKNKENIPIYSPEFLKKYIAYAKLNYKPELTNESQELIETFYLQMRKLQNDSIAITPRQLESVIRLSEASAKIRLSNTVEKGDVQRATDIIKEYLKRVCTDKETGKIDVDTIFSGSSHTQQERMKIIMSIIERSPDGIAVIENIIREAEIKGIESNKTEESLERLKQDKYIFEINRGRYKLDAK